MALTVMPAQYIDILKQFSRSLKDINLKSKGILYFTVFAMLFVLSFPVGEKAPSPMKAPCAKDA